MKKALLFNQLDKDTLECQTCAHQCRLKIGQVGICGIRQNLKQKLYLLPYGRAVAVNLDPIEKKPLFHFFPGSQVLSFGTFGCNLRCDNCQNFDISQILGKKGRLEAIEAKGRIENNGRLKAPGVFNWGSFWPPQKLVEQALALNAKSIAATYNEPTVFLEYALDTMKLAQKQGLKNVWVSNGFMSPAALKKITPYLDAINVDLKSFDNEFYQKHCGALLEPILENLKTLVKNKIWVEITTLVIPGLTDAPANLKKIAQFIKKELGTEVPWHLSAFSGAISWKLKDLPETPLETIEKAVALGKAAGLKYVYGGNVTALSPEENLENTICPKCVKIVVERQGYAIKNNLLKGKCRYCGAKLAGIWN